MTDTSSSTQTKVVISVHASKLKGRKSSLGLSSGKLAPYAVVTVLAAGRHETPQILGKTEVIKNCLSPEWVTTFETYYSFGKESKFNVSIFDDIKKTGEVSRLGSTTFEIGEVCASRGCVKTRKLKQGGTVRVRVSKAAAVDYGSFHLQLRGVNLKNVEGLFSGKSDPFFVLQAQINDAGGRAWQRVYLSEPIRNNLNPKWNEMSISMEKLCAGDEEQSIQIEVWDWEKSGNHRPMGKFQTCVKGLITKCATYSDGSQEHDDDSMAGKFNLVHKGKSYGSVAVSLAYRRGGGVNLTEPKPAINTRELSAENSSSQPASNRSQEEVQERFIPLLHREGKVFRKKVSSYIRKATKGEEIVTTINGVHESQRTVDDDTSWVVCGKIAGEYYVLTDEEFRESYDVASERPIPTDAHQSTRRLFNQGFSEYDSKRFVWGRKVDDEDMRYFLYGADKPSFAYFAAPWGENTRVEKGDFLVTQYKADGKCDGEVYRVEDIVFEDSYDETTTQSNNKEHPPARTQQEVQDRFVPLLHDEGKIFRKKLSSYIRKATQGERVVTAIDGVHETQKTVDDDSSWVVCAKAAGESYVLTDKEFHESYYAASARVIPPDVPQSKRLQKQGYLEYDSKRYVWGRNVDAEDMGFFANGDRTAAFAYFVAPWGETMRVEKGDFLVTQHVPDGEGNNEVYRVEQMVFEESYADVDDTPAPRLQQSSVPKPEFFDYISGGTEINLVVAIDFTETNGDPAIPGSLHYINPDGQLNDYEKALTAVGSVVARYDSDQMFPVLGFGARMGSSGRTSQCFRVGNAPELRGIPEVMKGYRSFFNSQLALGESTGFAGVIQYAASQARKKQDTNHKAGSQAYTILLILTSGAITDIERTKQAIRQASTAPLSIVIVGVGDADFSILQFLDDFQSAEGGLSRDIVQFVEFSKHKHSREALTKETLNEIPDQLVGYFFGNGIMPLPVAEIPDSDMTASEFDEEDTFAAAIDVSANGDVTVASNAPGAFWDGQSYMKASAYFPTLARGASGQVPPAASLHETTAVPVAESYIGAPNQFMPSASTYQPAATHGAEAYAAAPIQVPPVASYQPASAHVVEAYAIPQNDILPVASNYQPASSVHVAAPYSGAPYQTYQSAPAGSLEVAARRAAARGGYVPARQSSMESAASRGPYVPAKQSSSQQMYQSIPQGAVGPQHAQYIAPNRAPYFTSNSGLGPAPITPAEYESTQSLPSNPSSSRGMLRDDSSRSCPPPQTRFSDSQNHPGPQNLYQAMN